jgi:hypothetical protein
MTERKPTELRHLNVRIPEAIRQRLASEAEQNDRSMNAEINARLEQSFQRDASESLVQAINRIESRMAALEARLPQPQTLGAQTLGPGNGAGLVNWYT